MPGTGSAGSFLPDEPFERLAKQRLAVYENYFGYLYADCQAAVKYASFMLRANKKIVYTLIYDAHRSKPYPESLLFPFMVLAA